MNSKPLKGITVLFLTTGHEATDNRVYDKEARTAAALGARVTVVGPCKSPVVGQDGVRIVRAPDPRGLLRRFLFQPWISELLAAGVKPDIVHLHDLELLQIVPFLRIACPRARIVYDVHEDYSCLVSIRSYIPRLLQKPIGLAVKGYEKTFTRLVDGVVAVTDGLADHFPRHQKIGLYNFPSLHFYQRAFHGWKPPGQRSYDLLHFGALSRPRAGFLAEVLQILNDRKPGLRTCVGGLSADAFRFLGPLVPEGTVLSGKTPYDRVPELLCDARVGLDVHPFPTENLKVAVPVKVFEYMACRCAVVTSTMPVLDQIFFMAQLDTADMTVIRAGTPDVYADAVLALLDRIERGDDPGSRLHAAALQHFVWEREAPKLVSFYLRLMGRKEASGAARPLSADGERAARR